MRTIEWTNALKRDYKKALSNPRYRDHALAGEYTAHRECHLKPDLLLIYKKPDETRLRFVRLGSHSELFRGAAVCFRG
jgi:mRNA interferase YafQ